MYIFYVKFYAQTLSWPKTVQPKVFFKTILQAALSCKCKQTSVYNALISLMKDIYLTKYVYLYLLTLINVFVVLD